MNEPKYRTERDALHIANNLIESAQGATRETSRAVDEALQQARTYDKAGFHPAELVLGYDGTPEQKATIQAGVALDTRESEEAVKALQNAYARLIEARAHLAWAHACMSRCARVREAAKYEAKTE